MQVHRKTGALRVNVYAAQCSLSEQNHEKQKFSVFCCCSFDFDIICPQAQTASVDLMFLKKSDAKQLINSTFFLNASLLLS